MHVSEWKACSSEMGIELPGWLTEPISWIGMTWPQADETKLFEAGQTWMSFGAAVLPYGMRANNAAQDVWTTNDGPAAKAFEDWWMDDNGPDDRLTEDTIASVLIGGALVLFAAVTLITKILWIIQLAILAVQVALALAAAFVSLGASTASIPAFIAACRTACTRILRRVIDDVIKKSIQNLLDKAKKLLKRTNVKPSHSFDTAPGFHTTPGAYPHFKTAPVNTTPVNTAPPMVRKPFRSDDEAKIRDYTGMDHINFNKYLRDPGEFTEERRRLYQTGTDALSESLSKLPGHPGRSYRNVELSDEALARYQPGRYIDEHGFSSTSTDFRVASSFDRNTIMTITGRNGRDISPYSFADESEVLYDKGTRFRTLSRTWDGMLGKWHIVLQEA